MTAVAPHPADLGPALSAEQALDDFADIGYSIQDVVGMEVTGDGFRIDLPESTSIDFRGQVPVVILSGERVDHRDPIAASTLALRLGIEDAEHAPQDMAALHNLLVNDRRQVAGQGLLFGTECRAATCDAAIAEEIIAAQAALTRNDRYRDLAAKLDGSVFEHQDCWQGISRKDAEREVSLIERHLPEDELDDNEELEEARQAVAFLDRIEDLTASLAPMRARLSALRAQADLPEHDRVDPSRIQSDGTIS